MARNKQEEETVVAAPAAGGTAVAPASAVDYDMLQQDGATTAIQTTQQDLAIPFLRVLQSNSPQVDRDSPKYVKGAEAGMFINTVTGQLWEGREGGVLVAVVAYQRSYTEWRPRSSDGKQAGGGGFVKDWGTDDSQYIKAKPSPEKKSKMVLPDSGNEMVYAGQYWVFVIDPETGTHQQVILALAGTQLKKSRRWNSLIKSEQLVHPTTRQPFTPPPFYRLYRLTTVPEQNDQGNWKGLKIDPDVTIMDIPNGARLYQEALSFKKGIDAGVVKAAPLDRDFGDDPDDPPQRDNEDKDTPF